MSEEVSADLKIKNVTVYPDGKVSIAFMDDSQPCIELESGFDLSEFNSSPSAQVVGLVAVVARQQEQIYRLAVTVERMSKLVLFDTARGL